MENKKMIYIGVPYTHPDKKVMEDRYELVSTITAHLVNRGFIVFSPITYGHTLCEFENMPRDFEFWNELCLSFLVTSDLLVCVKTLGWEESRGLEAEMEFAFENGISILDLELENGEFNISKLEINLEIFEEFGVLPAPKSEVKLPFEGSCWDDSPDSIEGIKRYIAGIDPANGKDSIAVSIIDLGNPNPFKNIQKTVSDFHSTGPSRKDLEENEVPVFHGGRVHFLDGDTLDSLIGGNIKNPFKVDDPQPNFNNLMVVLDSVPNGNLQISLASFDLDLGICGPNITMPLTNNSEAIRVADFMEDYELIWSKSTKYDLPLLERVLESFDLDIPWASEQERCVNTFVHHMPHIAEECVFEGDPEDGFDVCKHQINYCHLIHKFLTCNSNGRL